MKLDHFIKARNEGQVYEFGNEDIVGFVYSHDTICDRIWNATTRAARGILFDRKTGVIVARPFDKFFNLFERPETEVDNLPVCPCIFEDKADGSLGIIFNYKGIWNISTKGSLDSDQAKYAREKLLPKYDFSAMDPSWTILTEIIYPANRIVLDYAGAEELRLLAVRHKHTGEEEPAGRLPIIANKMGMPCRKTYDVPTKDITQLPFWENMEGYVVRFDNGLRVKVKNPWYLRIHKALDSRSLKHIIELLEGGEWRAFWDALPKELQKDFDDLYSQVRTAIWDVERRAREAWDTVAATGAHLNVHLNKTRRREFAIAVQTKVDPELHPIMFAMVDGQDWRWLVFRIIKGKML